MPFEPWLPELECERAELWPPEPFERPEDEADSSDCPSEAWLFLDDPFECDPDLLELFDDESEEESSSEDDEDLESLDVLEPFVEAELELFFEAFLDDADDGVELVGSGSDSEDDT